MLLWVSRSLLIGALVGCLLMAVVGYLLGGVMGSLASLTSLGNPDLVKNEALRLASYGAAFGVIAGSVTGGLIGTFGHVRVVAIGAAVGALSLALGGAAFGSITVNDRPVDWTKLIVFSLIGAALGVMAGAVLGWIASPLDRYFVGKLRGTI
jgi:hypothetical protein